MAKYNYELKIRLPKSFNNRISNREDESSFLKEILFLAHMVTESVNKKPIAFYECFNFGGPCDYCGVCNL